MQTPPIDPTPPALHGLTWRPVNRADLAALVELGAACLQADGGLGFLFQPNNLQEQFFPDASDAGIGAFAADGRLVACAVVCLAGEPGQQRAVLVGHVHPQQRKRGIGSFLMRWSEARARSRLLAAQAEHKLLQVRTESFSEPADRLYIAQGFSSVFEELVMRCDLRPALPVSALPPDATISTWRPDLNDQMYAAYYAAFRDRPGFPGYSAAEWLESWTTDDDLRPEWSLLARVGEQPAGFLTAADDPPGGFVIQVGVIPSQRRRGLASALLVEAMRRMLADGATSVQLVVNVNNPGAIQTYAKLGFATVGRRARYERTLD